MEGASVEAQQYAVNIKNGTGSAQTFATNQKTIQTVMSETSIASKAAAVGLNIFKTALNSFIIFAVIEGIQLLVKWIDNLILTAEEAEEKAETLRSNMQSFFDEVQSGQQTISSISDRFSELSDHVTETGQNIDLTKDEYSEYLDICDQVKSIMPELVSGYTNEGNAIISLKDDVNDLTEAYKENIRAKAAAFITNGDDEGNTVQSFFDDYKIFTNGENGLFAPSGGGLWNNKSTDFEDYYGYDKVHEWLESVVNLSLEDLQNMRGGTLQSSYLGTLLKESGYEIADITEDNYEAVHDVLDARLTSLEGEMTTRVSNIKMSLQQMLYADSDYWNIDSDDALSAIDSLFSSIDAEYIKQNNLLGQAALQTFESNVIKLFKNKDTQGAMIDIYTPQGDDESVEDYSKRVNDAIAGVQKYVDDNKIPISLDFEDIKESSDKLVDSYNQTITNAQEKFDTKMSEDQLSAVEYYNQATKSAEEYRASLDDIYKSYNGINNVDRDIIYWDDENLEKYKSFIESWGESADDLKGTWSTVLGSSENIDGVEVAFTAMLQTDHGLVPLEQDTFWDYFDTIFNQSWNEDGTFNADKFIQLDSEGADMMINGQMEHVANMIAAAEGQYMNGVKLTADDVIAIGSPGYDENGNDLLPGNNSKYKGNSMHEVQEWALENRYALAQLDEQAKKSGTTINQLIEDAEKFGDNIDWESWFAENVHTQEEIDKWREITQKDFKDGKSAIKSYQNALKALKETTSSARELSEINEDKSGLSGLFDKYESGEGVLTQDEVASILEENPEYIEYLIKVGDQYKLNQQALEDWNAVNEEQELAIDNQMGGNEYLESYEDLLDSISLNSSHPITGTIDEQLDDLISKNKEWNTSLQNGEISAAQYFQNISNSITSSGLEQALSSLNGEFNDATDYIEEMVSTLSTELSDALLQSSKRFLKGETSVADYIDELQAGTDAQKKLLSSTYNFDIDGATGKANLDGLSDSAKEAAESYNELIDAQQGLADTSGFVDVLSENAEFISQYTDSAGNLMDSIFSNNQLDSYVSSMTNSIVDFANTSQANMATTAQWLADTANISVEQASSLISQGGAAVSDAVGTSLNGVQNMTNFAMNQVSGSITNASTAIGNVLTSLGNMISNFDYSITATPKITGSFGIHKDANGIPDGLTLPTFGFDIKGSGGSSVSQFASSLKSAGSYFNQLGTSQANAKALDINSYKPTGTSSGGKSSGYRPTYKSSDSSSGGSGSDSDSSDEDSYDETIDFFEQRVKVLQQSLDILDKSLENVLGSKRKNQLLSAQSDIVSEEMNNYTDALAMYQAKADEALSQIDSSLRDKVVNGAVSITEFIGEGNEDTVEAINNYQSWAEKVCDCKEQLAELAKQLREIELSKFNNIVDEFTDKTELFESATSNIEKQIDLFEQAGQVIGEAFYDAQKQNSQRQLNLLEEEKTKLVEQLNNSLSSGKIQKGTDEWVEMVGTLSDLDGSILDCKKSIEEMDDAILNLHTEEFERIQTAFSNIKTELEDIYDLIGDNDDVSLDDGTWTNVGITRLGLLAQQYETAKLQAQRYGEEIDQLNSDYLAGKYSATEYAEKLADLTQNQYDSLQAAESIKDSIVDINQSRVDIMTDAINKETEAYQELIQAKKDALSAEQDYKRYFIFLVRYIWKQYSVSF